MNKKISFNLKNTTPIQQGLVVLCAIVLISIVCVAIQKRDVMYWNFIIIPFFLFTVYNPIIGAFQKKLLPYMGISALVFIGLAATVYFLGNLVSNFSYGEVRELHIIAPTILIFYFMFNFLCFVFRSALHYLNRI